MTGIIDVDICSHSRLEKFYLWKSVALHNGVILLFIHETLQRWKSSADKLRWVQISSAVICRAWSYLLEPYLIKYQIEIDSAQKPIKIPYCSLFCFCLLSMYVAWKESDKGHGLKSTWKIRRSFWTSTRPPVTWDWFWDNTKFLYSSDWIPA